MKNKGKKKRIKEERKERIKKGSTDGVMCTQREQRWEEGKKKYCEREPQAGDEEEEGTKEEGKKETKQCVREEGKGVRERQ